MKSLRMGYKSGLMNKHIVKHIVDLDSLKRLPVVGEGHPKRLTVRDVGMMPCAQTSV